MTTKKKKPLIFMCYAKSDIEEVRKIYELLVTVGADPWLDVCKLLPGDFWEAEIQNIVTKADSFVVFLSKNFNSKGFRQKEIRYALNALDTRPPGEGFIIPFVLEPCDIPAWCEKLHVVDPTSPTDPEYLIKSINKICKIDLALLTSSIVATDSDRSESPTDEVYSKEAEFIIKNDIASIMVNYSQSKIERKVTLRDTVLTLLHEWENNDDDSIIILRKLIKLCDKKNMAIHSAVPFINDFIQDDIQRCFFSVEFVRFCLKILNNIASTENVERLAKIFLSDQFYTDLSLLMLSSRRHQNFIWAFPISINVLKGSKRIRFLKRVVQIIFRDEIISGSERRKILETIFCQKNDYPFDTVLSHLREWLGLVIYFPINGDGDLRIFFGDKISSKRNDDFFIGRLSSSKINHKAFYSLISHFDVEMNNDNSYVDKLLKTLG